MNLLHKQNIDTNGFTRLTEQPSGNELWHPD